MECRGWTVCSHACSTSYTLPPAAARGRWRGSRPHHHPLCAGSPSSVSSTCSSSSSSSSSHPGLAGGPHSPLWPAQAAPTHGCVALQLLMPALCSHRHTCACACTAGMRQECLPTRARVRACTPTRTRRRRRARCRSSSKQEVIQGYTPANYVSWSETEAHACRYLVGVQVQAPVSVCFELWDDWARLVDFLDLISQVRGRVLRCCARAGSRGGERKGSRHLRCAPCSPLPTPLPRLGWTLMSRTWACSSASTDGVSGGMGAWVERGTHARTHARTATAGAQEGAHSPLWPTLRPTPRAGRMPVMEVVFLARKLHVERNKLIQFDTVWGMPAKGEREGLCACGNVHCGDLAAGSSSGRAVRCKQVCMCECKHASMRADPDGCANSAGCRPSGRAVQCSAVHSAREC